jgi:hypothetical protein
MANKTPIGKQKIIEKTDINKVRKRPPQTLVSTSSKPREPP